MHRKWLTDSYLDELSRIACNNNTPDSSKIVEKNVSTTKTMLILKFNLIIILTINFI